MLASFEKEEKFAVNSCFGKLSTRSSSNFELGQENKRLRKKIEGKVSNICEQNIWHSMPEIDERQDCTSLANVAFISEAEIKDIEKEILKVVDINPTPFKQKVEIKTNSLEKESLAEKPKGTGVFQWILRIAGLSFCLLSFMLLVVLLVKHLRQGKRKTENSDENVLDEKNVVRFVNTKFRAPASEVRKTGGN